MSGSSQTFFLFDPAGRLVGDYQENQATPQTGDWLLKQETVWFGDIPVAVIKQASPTDPIQVYTIHAGHLNTPRVIVDSTNTPVWLWSDNRAFGNTLPDEDPDGDSQLFEYNLRFAGQYFDSETNLHYNYFRDYDSETGRYISSDPIGLAGGLNTYGYALQNPLLYTDPYGLFGVANLPVLPQGFVDSAAGFGDGLSGGITNWVRDQAGTNGAVNKCSSNYSDGHITGAISSLGLGVGRLVYAGLAKGYSITAPSGAAASIFRSQLRRASGGGKSLRPPNLARYSTDKALRGAAGRTNPYANAAGVAAAAAGTNSLINGSECGCSQ